MTPEPFITISELAKRETIPLGKTKLYEMANAGDFPSYRVGKKILVLESEVYEAIKRKFVRSFRRPRITR